MTPTHLADTMVERVARVIYETHGFAHGWDHPALNEAWKPLCTKQARAAIVAVHDELSKLIVTGQLQGNGCDKTAERNGIIRACNHLFVGGVASDATRAALSESQT